MINREHKDRLFKFIFGNADHPEWTLSLYNALNHSNYTNSDDIEYTTIDDALYLGMKNDVSFILMNEAAFWEHQASFNPNMPVRFFIYAARVYDGYMIYHDMYRYGTVLQKLPKPRCLCFYNGEDKQPEVQELRLSDAFGGTDGDIEVRVRMLNVNYGHNRELLEACKPIGEYAWFVEAVRRHKKNVKNLFAAIDAALEEMPDNFQLKKFLLAHKAEVRGMYLTEYNEEKERLLAREEAAKVGRAEGREEGRAEGIAEGRAEGRAEGEAEAKKHVVAEMLKEHMPLSMISKISALSEQAVMEIAQSLGIEAV